jgi:hypothetical protein
MEARIENEFDWSEHSRSHLAEASLRLLAALGTESRFPGDVAGVEELLGRVAEGRPGEAMDFAVESAGDLPRYSDKYMVWVSPAAEGCLRLRHETGDRGLVSEVVTLQPDGRLGEFETIEGFGVPDSELTDQARADREAVERLTRERQAEEIDTSREIDEDQRRFRTEHLLGVVPGPSQDPAGPVVSFLALYDTGVIVYYLVPRPSEEDLETDDPWAEPLEAAMTPTIELSDDSGTAYEMVDLAYLDPNAPLMRASQRFVPAVPATASRLVVRFASASVEIELGPR